MDFELDLKNKIKANTANGEGCRGPDEETSKYNVINIVQIFLKKIINYLKYLN